MPGISPICGLAWEHHHRGEAQSIRKWCSPFRLLRRSGSRADGRSGAAGGLSHVTLVEEPLAAFYHWLEGHQDKLAESLAGVSLVLVVDVGGGTSDFTLIQVSSGEDGMRLDRIAVG